MTIDDDQVVVIGSGPCGAVSAVRLVERGVRVVMLDAGLHAPRGLLVRVAGRTVWRMARLLSRVDDALDARPKGKLRHRFVSQFPVVGVLGGYSAEREGLRRAAAEADALLSGWPMTVTPEGSRRNIAVMQAATASAADGGRPVEVTS